MMLYFWIKFAEIKYDIRRECKCGIVFGNLLDQVYKFIDMPYYKLNLNISKGTFWWKDFGKTSTHYDGIKRQWLEFS